MHDYYRTAGRTSTRRHDYRRGQSEQPVCDTRSDLVALIGKIGEHLETAPVRAYNWGKCTYLIYDKWVLENRLGYM